MKTISVKEAAEALGVRTRAIQYKLQYADTQSKNQYSVAQWRVWTNKDTAEPLAKKQGGNFESSADAINFSPNDSETIEAEDVAYVEGEGASDEPSNWRQVEIERLEIIAEKIIKPLAERIEAQAVALSEQEKIIEDQKRQLRLLPDLEKQAEEERKTAHLRALEVEALNKQIAAMEEQKKEELQAKANQVNSLVGDLAALKAKVEELQTPWWKRWAGVQVAALLRRVSPGDQRL